MIEIAGREFDYQNFKASYPLNQTSQEIISIMSSSTKTYYYDSKEQLIFSLDLKLSTISAAKEFFRSGVKFKTFRRSECNNQYWERTEEGGFLLKGDAAPSDGIQDIFINGTQYGTECSTAIVIIYLKALLNIFPKELFDRLYQNIYLMNWQSIDRDMGLIYVETPPDHFPGDGRYFKNPDVDPLSPEWQGENVIDLGSGFYYGHGIGIGTADKIIYALNQHRKDDSEISAYLLESVNYMDSQLLYPKYSGSINEAEVDPGPRPLNYRSNYSFA